MEAASPSLSEIFQECKQAVKALRKGSYNKALRLLKEPTPKFDNSASLKHDADSKQRHQRNMVEASKKASTLNPNSIKYSLFYANSMFEICKDAKDYDAVIAECERALALDNPNDPAKDILEEDGVAFTAEAKEARVAPVKAEIKALDQKAKLSCTCAWMRSSGGVTASEENNRFRLVPVEARYLNGIENVNEIEDRV